MSEEQPQNGPSDVEVECVKKPVVIIIRSRGGKGHQIRHWVLLGVSDLEGGVAFAPMATDINNALDLTDEFTLGAKWRAIEETDYAYVVTLTQDPAVDALFVPLVWRGHPVRVVTMDSPTEVDARIVLGRYRGRMAKELRFYRGDLSEEVLQ